MYITFRNNSKDNKVTVTANNRSITINPEASADIFFSNNTVEFSAYISPLEALNDAIADMDEEIKDYGLKDKIIAKLTKLFAKKLNDMMLNIEVGYRVDFNASENAVVDLYDGVYSVCDGKFADFLDMVPVMYSFSRVETDNGKISVNNISLINKKKYLKFFRNLLLFANSGLIIVDWFLFIPSYLIVRYFASDFYVRNLLKRLYSKNFDLRQKILDEKERSIDKDEKGGSCLSTLIKVVVFLLILAGLVIWANNGENDVVLSEDLSVINCFEETYVRIDGALPKNAEKSFLESYFAFYPLNNGEYDSDRFYCNVYETADGTRYILMTDNEDTENPLVYILNESKGE